MHMFCIAIVLGATGCAVEEHRTVELLVQQDSTNVPLVDSTATDSLPVLESSSPIVSAVTHVVKMTTSLGKMEFELYGEDAPLAVENFVRLAKRGYYNRTLFHRVAQNFMIQGGDRNTRFNSRRDDWGNGGESSFANGEPFADEIGDTPAMQRGYVRGTLAMANKRRPNTNTSQFFVCLRTLPELNKNKIYTIFGQLRAGFEVLDSIGAVEVAPVRGEFDGMPVDPIRIRSISVTTVQ